MFPRPLHHQGSTAPGAILKKFDGLPFLAFLGIDERGANTVKNMLLPCNKCAAGALCSYVKATSFRIGKPQGSHITPYSPPSLAAFLGPRPFLGAGRQHLLQQMQRPTPHLAGRRSRRSRSVITTHHDTSGHIRAHQGTCLTLGWVNLAFPAKVRCKVAPGFRHHSTKLKKPNRKAI